MRFGIKVSCALVAFIAAASSTRASAQTPEFTDVLRFKTNGDLDSTFSGNGRKLVASVPQYMYAKDLAQAASGKLVMGMNIDWFNGRFVVGRLNTNGSPDTSFSDDGFADIGQGKVEAVATRGTYVYAIGSIGNNALVVVRYNDSGVADALVSLSLPGWDLLGRAIVTRANGQVYVVGRAANGAESRFFIASLFANLNLDTSFSGDGMKLIAFPGWEDSEANAVAIDDTEGSGRIALVGPVTNGGLIYQIGVALLSLYDGSYITFDGDGRKTFAAGGSAVSAVANAVAIDRSRRIVVGGTAEYSDTEHRYVVARLHATGAFDADFSTDGLLRFGFAGTSAVDLRDLKITSDAGIVAAGGAYGAGFDFFNAVSIALIKSDGTMNDDFSGDGRVVFDAPNSEVNTANGVVIDSQGRFITAGPILDPTAE